MVMDAVSTPQSLKRKVSGADISPLPTVCSNSSSSTRWSKGRTTKAAVLTSSPYKRQLEEDQSHKLKRVKQSKKETRVTAKPATGRPAAKKSRQSKKSLVDDADDSSWFCKLCNECIKENMIKCQHCNDWMHCDCAGVSGHVKRFICDLCK